MSGVYKQKCNRKKYLRTHQDIVIYHESTKCLNTHKLQYGSLEKEKENMLLNFSPALGKHLWLVTLSA
jgi:hypothetical protein